MKAIEEAKQALRRLFLRREAPAEKTIWEQQKEVIDLAEEFDRLTALPAWEKALRFMAEGVNGNLVEATKYKKNPRLMAVYVTRWDARREALDDLVGWINNTLTERDRIVEDYKERANGGNPAATGN